MKAIFFSLTGLLALALAQSISQLPQCAQGCVGSSINVPGCSGTLDIKCICSNKDYLNNIACCLASACNAADQQTAVQYAQSICTAAGVTVPDKVICNNSTSTTSTASAASGSTSPSGNLATSAVSVSASSKTNSPSAVSSGSIESTASSAATQPSTGAASRLIGNGVGLAGAIVAAVAIL